MKILYVGNFAADGSPLGVCPNADYISDTLEELGHEVTRFDEIEYTAPEILAELEKKYDLLLCEEGRLKGDFENDEETDRDKILGYFSEVMEKAGMGGIPVVPWLTNLFFGIMRREPQIKQNPIFKADIVFTTDGGHEEEFKKAGVNHRLLRQGIYQKETYFAPADFPTKAEIGFVGGIYESIWPYRKELIDWLKLTYGERFEHFGERGEIRHDKLNRLCSTLKIVVGDSVVSPHYWSNRLYEIIGRGGFLIFPKVEGIEKEFTPYKHFIPYTLGNYDQLKEIIDYYLTHDDEREQIRYAGFQHCKENHTYLHRVKEMLRILEEEKII